MAQDANTQVRTSWKDLHAHTTLTFTRGLLGFSCSLDRHGGLWRLSFPPPKLSFCFSLHFKIHIGTMFSRSYHNLAHLNTVVILQFVTILLKQFHTSPPHTPSPWWLLPCLSCMTILKYYAQHALRQVCWMDASDFYWVGTNTGKTVFYPSDHILSRFQIAFWNRYNSKANGTKSK